VVLGAKDANMFRRRPNTLPSDPVFEPKLDKLGFFVNEHDQIRMIRNPEAKYTFKVNSNERVNYVYRQACNSTSFDLICESTWKTGKG
jgi:hypothetical protein